MVRIDIEEENGLEQVRETSKISVWNVRKKEYQEHHFFKPLFLDCMAP